MLFWCGFLIVVRLAIACPSVCVCKWKGGKRTVECVNKGLITIPDGMDHGTQVLDFTNNNLRNLPRERFQRMGLMNLQKIYLSHCRIYQIDDRAFRGLSNLVELDLSDNMIATIPSETFTDYPSLMRLTLTGNPIRYIKSLSFQPLSFLNNLELSHCLLEIIDDKAFIGLDRLEWLYLDNNRLQHIKGSYILPEKLHQISLQQNPWHCDCQMLDLRSWMIRYSVPRSSEPKCTSPQRLKGRVISLLEVNELACLPDTTPTNLYLETAEGKNISLLCRVTAIPEAKVSWWFQGSLLQNDSLVAPGLHFYYYLEEVASEKRSELFIFNTNTEDNGTFFCVAENAAGKSQSNYTVRIVLKEEPKVVPTPFPYEYVVMVSASVSVGALILILLATICFVRVRRKGQKKHKRKKKKDIGSGESMSKAPVVKDVNDHMKNIGTILSPPALTEKNGSSCNDKMQRDVEFNVEGSDFVIHNNLIIMPKYGSPSQLQSYVIEQNPDLINDMDSGKSLKLPNHALPGDFNVGVVTCREVMKNILEELDQRKWRENGPSNLRTPLRRFSGSGHMFQNSCSDIHIPPAKYIGDDGYPIDFGLPKINKDVVPPPAAYCRTLPHKSKQKGVNHFRKFSTDNEFILNSPKMSSYGSYNKPDVRYTAEGYPRQEPEMLVSETDGSFNNFPSQLPSPPPLFKGDIVPRPKEKTSQWTETSPDAEPI